MDAFLAGVRADSQAHPAYLGGPATATQQLRRSTPPAGLPAEAMQGLRRAAEKVFQVWPGAGRGGAGRGGAGRGGPFNVRSLSVSRLRLSACSWLGGEVAGEAA